MKKIILNFIICLLSLMFGFAGFWFAEEQTTPAGDSTSTSECDWVQLNTDVPFVWNCIKKDNTATAFPTLMWGLTKMVVTAILIISFLLIIAWWVMIAMWWAEQSLQWKGKDLILKVIIWIALLGTSWIILHIINPNFFK